MNEVKRSFKKTLWIIGLATFLIGFIPGLFDLVPNCILINTDLGFGGHEPPAHCKYYQHNWPGVFVFIGSVWLLTMLGTAGLNRIISYKKGKMLQ